MRLQSVSGRIQFRACIVNHVVGLSGGADVFHAAAEISHRCLRILGIRVFHAGLFREEFDHLWQSRSRNSSFLEFFLINVGDDWNTVIVASYSGKFAYDY